MLVAKQPIGSSNSQRLNAASGCSQAQAGQPPSAAPSMRLVIALRSRSRPSSRCSACSAAPAVQLTDDRDSHRRTSAARCRPRPGRSLRHRARRLISGSTASLGSRALGDHPCSSRLLARDTHLPQPAVPGRTGLSCKADHSRRRPRYRTRCRRRRSQLRHSFSAVGPHPLRRHPSRARWHSHRAPGAVGLGQVDSSVPARPLLRPDLRHRPHRRC